MIGLEYILQLYNVTLTDLSKEQNIARANYYNWISGKRKMPEKYEEIFSERFNMPKEYFSKQLDDEDKIKIQTIKIKNDIDAGGIREVYKNDLQNKNKTDEELEDVFKNDMLAMLEKTKKLQNQMTVNNIEKQLNETSFDEQTITTLIYTKIYELLYTKGLDRKTVYTLLVAFGKQYDEDDMWIEKGYYDKDLLEEYIKLFKDFEGVDKLAKKKNNKE